MKFRNGLMGALVVGGLSLSSAGIGGQTANASTTAGICDGSVRVASANVGIHASKAEAVNAYETVQNKMSRRGVVGWQEIDAYEEDDSDPRQEHKWLSNTFDGSKWRNRAMGSGMTPTSVKMPDYQVINERVWELPKTAGKSMSAVLLKNPDNGHRLAVVNWYGTRAYMTNEPWLRQWNVVNNYVTDKVSRGIDVVVVGDVNRTDGGAVDLPKKPHPSAVKMKVNWVDWVWAVPGKGRLVKNCGSGEAALGIDKHKMIWSDVAFYGLAVKPHS